MRPASAAQLCAECRAREQRDCHCAGPDVYCCCDRFSKDSYFNVLCVREVSFSNFFSVIFLAVCESAQEYKGCSPDPPKGHRTACQAESPKRVQLRERVDAIIAAREKSMSMDRARSIFENIFYLYTYSILFQRDS